MNIKFDDLKNDIFKIVHNTIKEHKKEALAAGLAFVEQSKEDVVKWAKMLKENQMDAEDVKWLMRSQLDSAQMEALKQAGMAVAAVDKFQEDIITTAFDFLNKIIIPV